VGKMRKAVSIVCRSEIVVLGKSKPFRCNATLM